MPGVSPLHVRNDRAVKKRGRRGFGSIKNFPGPALAGTGKVHLSLLNYYHLTEKLFDHNPFSNNCVIMVNSEHIDTGWQTSHIDSELLVACFFY